MTAKKGTTKKSSAVRTAPRAPKGKVKRVLARAEGPQCFWVHDGSILADLVELERALDAMAPDIFSYHVQKERNDFADWIEFVLGDTELAGMLRGAMTPQKTRALVVRRLKIYQL